MCPSGLKKHVSWPCTIDSDLIYLFFLNRQSASDTLAAKPEYKDEFEYRLVYLDWTIHFRVTLPCVLKNRVFDRFLIDRIDLRFACIFIKLKNKFNVWPFTPELCALERKTPYFTFYTYTSLCLNCVLRMNILIALHTDIHASDRCPFWATCYIMLRKVF